MDVNANNTINDTNLKKNEIASLSFYNLLICAQKENYDLSQENNFDTSLYLR